MKNIIKRICVSSCVIFSVLILIICSGIALIGVEEGFGLDHTIVFALFILSFVIACTTAIYSHTKLNGALKYIIHLIVTLGASAVFLRIVNGLDGKTILIAVIIIAILHAAVFAILHSIKKTNRKEEKYESLYNKKDTDKGNTK
ncbi:MAG: hypothetical protein IJZ89_08705 [Clostridia bacterium]|nr:hypothetical protein [Clostridia bacterium]